MHSQYSGAHFVSSLLISQSVCDISRAFSLELALISGPDSNWADYLHEIMKLVAMATPPVAKELVSDTPLFLLYFEEALTDHLHTR